MLVTAQNNLLQFVNVSLSCPTCINSYRCGSEITGIEVSYDNELLFCRQKTGNPFILNIADLDNIKLADRIDALPSICVAKFRRNKDKTIVLGTGLSSVATYSIESRSILKIRSVPAPVISICLNASDTRLLVGCTNKSILIFQPDQMEKLQVYKIESPLHSMEFHPTHENVCAIHHEKYMLSLFNLDSNRFLFKKKMEGMKDFCFVPTHHFIVTIGDGYRCSMQDLKNFKYVFHHNLPVEPMCLVAVNNFIAIGGNDGTVIIFDMYKYAFPWKRFQVCGSQINNLRFLYNTNIITDWKNMQEVQNDGSLVQKIDGNHRPYCLVQKKYMPRITNNEIVVSDTPKRVLAQMSRDLVVFARENVAGAIMRVNKQLACFESLVKNELNLIKEYNDKAWKDIIQKTLEMNSVGNNNSEPHPKLAKNINLKLEKDNNIASKNDFLMHNLPALDNESDTISEPTCDILLSRKKPAIFSKHEMECNTEVERKYAVTGKLMLANKPSYVKTPRLDNTPPNSTICNRSSAGSKSSISSNPETYTKLLPGVTPALANLKKNC